MSTFEIRTAAGLRSAKNNMLAKVLLALTFIVVAFIVRPESAVAQSDNIMAQGFYYRAKDLHEAGRHSEALPYISRAKQSLGGTNQQLQYLHIMTLVGSRDFVTANRELERFFSLSDNRESAVRFANIVDRLTEDEQRQLTRVMVEIMEAADRQTYAQREAAALDEILNSLDQILEIGRSFQVIKPVGSSQLDTRYNASRSGAKITFYKEQFPKNGRRQFWSEVTVSVDSIKSVSSGYSAESAFINFDFAQSNSGVAGARLHSNNPEKEEQDTYSGFIFSHFGSAPPVTRLQLEAEVDYLNRLLVEYRAMR